VLSLSISSTDLAKLESSVNFLEIMSKDNTFIFKSKLKPIKVPNTCYPIIADNEIGLATPGDDASEQLKDTKCYHSNRFYDEGEQWYSSTETCTVCACNNRRFKCEPIKCPPVKCKKDEQMVKKGDNCCPSCEGESRELSSNR
jgi:chordin